MAMLAKLRDFLEQSAVPFEVHRHKPASTATATAAADRVPQSEMAKVVLLRSGDDHVMAVIPACKRLDLDRIRRVADDPALELASEDEVTRLFPGCETGAMPPFGNLFGMPVWVDDTLGREAETVFTAGNHRETVHMRYADFVRLVRPSFGDLARPL